MLLLFQTTKTGKFLIRTKHQHVLVRYSQLTDFLTMFPALITQFLIINIYESSLIIEKRETCTSRINKKKKERCTELVTASSKLTSDKNNHAVQQNTYQNYKGFKYLRQLSRRIQQVEI